MALPRCLLLLMPLARSLTDVSHRMDHVLQQLVAESQQLITSDMSPQGLEELHAVLFRLEDCLAKLQDLQVRQDKSSAGMLVNGTSAKLPQPIDDFASRVSRELQPFIVVGLVCVTVALMKGRRPLDLFSVDIYSPWEAALAFTLSSFTGLVLVNQWVLSFLPDNPFTLYFSELAMCFLAVTTCAPLLMGASKSSTKWHAFASFVAVICFGALCLADEISRVVFFFLYQEKGGSKSGENYSLVLVPCLVVVTLYVGLFLTSFLKVLHRWGLKWRCVEPYGVELLRNCKSYVAARLAGRAGIQDLPVPLPAAVLVQVAGVGSFMAMLVLQMAYLGYVRYNELRLLAVALLRPIEPLFKIAGAPLPMDAVDFAMPRIIVSYYLALACGACYEVWLMVTVLRGYRRMFADLAMGRRYHGQDLVKSAGPGIFHAQWATYCCGALIGNAAMALVLLMFFLWILFLVLSLPQFYQMMWGLRTWWIVYGLTYATRWSVFRFVIPQKVVTDDGSVLRRRVWDLVFPTLTLLNFVLGATSGVIRSVVIAPYLLIHFFRIDITYLPSDLCDWDWSFQPFVSLVLHSHRRLNPILLATVAELGKSAQQGATTRRQEQEQELGRVEAIDLAAPSASELTQDLPQRARTTPAAPHSRRARQRWQLALILARNPSLRRMRKTSYGGRADTAPACLGTQEDTLMPLRLPGLPRRLESSSTSFWSPLSRAVGNRTPLLSESAPVFPPEEAEATQP